MQVNRLAGLKTLVGFRPRIASSAAAQPEGLLRHESVIYSLFPMHVGMRQYWRDMDTLLAWSRSDPHRLWWQNFLRDTGGTGFWHETYFMRGGMEAIYDDSPMPLGLSVFASVHPARGGRIWRAPAIAALIVALALLGARLWTRPVAARAAVASVATVARPPVAPPTTKPIVPAAALTQAIALSPPPRVAAVPSRPHAHKRRVVAPTRDNDEERVPLFPE